MKISIDELRTLPQQKAPISFKETIEGLDAVKPVTGDLVISANSTGMKVQGTVQTLLKLTCDRCLGPYFLAITVHIDERYVEAAPELRQEKFTRERELTAEDFVEYLDEDGILDICDVVYQAVTLATPATTSCGNECPGPAFPAGKTKSGALATDNQAGTEARPIDPRWKNLKSLFPNRDTDEKS